MLGKMLRNPKEYSFSLSIKKRFFNFSDHFRCYISWKDHVLRFSLTLLGAQSSVETMEQNLKKDGREYFSETTRENSPHDGDDDHKEDNMDDADATDDEIMIDDDDEPHQDIDGDDYGHDYYYGDKYDDDDEGDDDDDDDDDDHEKPCFRRDYPCYPLSVIEKSEHENKDRIILPETALKSLVAIGADYPILFQIKNKTTGRISHCGVLEFTSTEHSVFMPDWMMNNLQLQIGDTVSLRNVTLQKGTSIKLQPHKTDFIRLPNPKSVLEENLCNFACLTSGDTIKIIHQGQDFFVDVVETGPSSAISIIDADIETDFAPPLDYREPAKDSKIVSEINGDEEDKKFRPFTGRARRLNEEVPTVTDISSVTEKASESSSGHKKGEGKLVFGSSKTRIQMEPKKLPEGMVSDKKKFQPFTGKKYTLSG